VRPEPTGISIVSGWLSREGCASPCPPDIPTVPLTFY
jgi:hypothetical protein